MCYMYLSASVLYTCMPIESYGHFDRVEQPIGRTVCNNLVQSIYRLVPFVLVEYDR